MLSQKKIKAIQLLIRSYFKNSKGEPFEITPSQCEIFEAVVNPHKKWVWISAPTRNGKTDVLSMAIIYLAAFRGLKIPVVAGSEDKANKIMEYVVSHLPDHPELYKGLINVDASQVEKLKITVSKDALRWHDGGWIFIVSIDSRSKVKEGEGAVGDGGDIIVLEEAGLIKDKAQFSKVVRMPEEDKGWGKLVMSGNCVEGSVFEDAFNNPLFHKVRITLETAVKEGRYTWAFINEKKTMTTSKDWKRYYLVEFPAANEFTYFKPQKYQYVPNKVKYYGALDPALGESKKGSLVGIVVLAVDEKGQAYQVEAIGKKLKPEEAIRTVFNLPYKFERFGIEAVQFQRYFIQVIDEKSKDEGKYIPFEKIEQKQKKEVRIESLEPHINTGHILFKGEDLIWEHMQEYPNTEFLDVLDTLEMAWRLVSGSSFDYSFL